MSAHVISELWASLCHTVFPSPNHINCADFLLLRLTDRTLVNTFPAKGTISSTAAADEVDETV